MSYAIATYLIQVHRMKNKIAWFLTKIAMRLDTTMRVSYEENGRIMVVARTIDQVTKGELVRRI